MAYCSALTINHIIDPVLLLQDAQGDSLTEKFEAFTKREILSRIRAVFTSALAFIDFGKHLAYAFYKTGHLALEELFTQTILRFFISFPKRKWQQDEIENHFEQAKIFAVITLIGSIIGVLWPSLFSYFPHTEALTPSQEKFSLTKRVHTLITVIQARKIPSKESLQKFWQESALLEKRQLSLELTKDNPLYKTVRETLIPVAFQKIDLSSSSFVRFFQRQTSVDWLSQKEIAERIGENEHSAFTQGFYFHTTSQKKLLEALQNQTLELSHVSRPPCAFISTKMETTFGSLAFVFRKSIERLFPLACGFQHKKSYWAGFASPLPITTDTLAYIIFNTTDEEKRYELEKIACTLAKRKIHVFTYTKAQEKTRKMGELHLGIPLEWTRMDSSEGDTLFNKLRLEAGQTRL